MAKGLDIKDVNIYYGAFKAVEDVNLTINPRSVTAFTAARTDWIVLTPGSRAVKTMSGIRTK